MRIIRLQAENVKRLRAVDITPDGNAVVITGRNGAGKSSVLDAIWMTLGGAPAAKGTPRPIRDGADHASVTVDLGDLRVTRTWSEERTTLRVESNEGALYKSPQAMLDKLVGRLSFDPLAFAEQDPKAQRATLLDLIGFDPSELDERRRELFETRTAVGREGKALDGQLAGMTAPKPGDVGAEEVSATDVLAEYEAAYKLVTEREGTERQVEAARRQVEDVRATLARAEKLLEDAEARLAGLPEAPDVDAIKTRLDSVETTNAQIRAAKQYRDVAVRRDARRVEYERLSGEIAAIDEEKAAAVRGAKMPIDGLAFDDDGVTYNGVPFSQCSSGERLRVSLAMAMAMNPQIRVIRITDGSLLDSANMALIEEMAVAGDFQVWIERVDESGQVGIVIEDGSVVETPAGAS